LDFLGSRVDQATSTVQANATFPNPDASVLPGQFVRIRIEGLKRYGVLAVPEIAVGQGLMGPQIFVLDENNVARARPVDLGEVAGPWQIIQGGVEPGERVVVGDLAGVQPGTTIEPQPFKGDADSLVEDAEASKEEARHRDMEKATEAEPGTATESAEDASS
jgi:membrane fusion protein (multidrug efflux system)